MLQREGNNTPTLHTVKNESKEKPDFFWNQLNIDIYNVLDKKVEEEGKYLNFFKPFIF